MYIWVHVHTKTRYLLNFCCNNLSKPTFLSNNEIFHYDFKAFLLSGQFKVFLTSRLPTCCTRFYVIVVYLAGIPIAYRVLYIIKRIHVFYSILFKNPFIKTKKQTMLTNFILVMWMIIEQY